MQVTAAKHFEYEYEFENVNIIATFSLLFQFVNMLTNNDLNYQSEKDVKKNTVYPYSFPKYCCSQVLVTKCTQIKMCKKFNKM